MASTIASVLHLSDLHFGAKGQLPVWKKLQDFIRTQLRPDAILVTGDIVDTPNSKLFKLAASELGMLCSPYQQGGPEVTVLACPGNHDRFYRGNRFGIPWPLGERFERYFRQFYLKAQTTVTLKGLTSIEVTSIDSTENARFFARGAVSSETLDGLKKGGATMSDRLERSLRILLMHHHLLPIAELEPERARLFKPFLAATTMVENAGHVLEALCGGRFDLVLHGHEHAFNLARFDSMTAQSLPITVVSASSSTGVVTAGACQFEKSFLNVLELQADETLWLNIYQHDENQQRWVSKERRLLMSDVDMRKAWFFRSSSVTEQDLGGRSLFEYTLTHDVVVHRTRCDYQVPDDQVLTISTSSMNAEPRDLRIRYMADGGMREIANVPFQRDRNERGVYRAQVLASDLTPGSKLSRLMSQYVLPGGSDATTSRLALRSKDEKDYFGNRGMDSVSAGMMKKRFAWYELSLLLPLAWAPNGGLGGVRAYVQRRGEAEPVLSESLTGKIIPSGDGHYSLRISYPDVETKYYLAWSVFDDSASAPWLPRGDEAGQETG